MAGYPAHPPDLDDPFHGHFQVILDRAFERAHRDGVGPLFTGMRGDLAAGPIDLGYGHLLQARRWSDLEGEVRRLRSVTGSGFLPLARRHLLPALRRRMTPRFPRRWIDPTTALPEWIDPDLAERVDLRSLLDRCRDVPAPPLEGPFRRRRYQWIFAPMHLRWAVSHERRAMRYGLTAVDPWSDRRLVEFCVAIPQQVLDPDSSLDKPLVREAMRGIMPDAFREKARKTTPLPLYEDTLRKGSADTVRNLLHRSRSEARGWLVAAPLLEAFERFVRREGSAPGELWWALSLEWWLRERERKEPRPTEAVAPAPPGTRTE